MRAQAGRRSTVMTILASLLVFGCTDGDVVRVLVPASPCGRPPDPEQVVLRPLWSRHQLLDAAWAKSDLAVAVGTGGIAMVWAGDRWRIEDAGTEQTLTAVAMRDDGEICAVGSGGILVRRRGGAWFAPQPVGTGTYRRLAVDETSFWACGDGGILARVSATGVEQVEPPHHGNLHDVFSQADSLWVLDSSDTLHVRVEGTWRNVVPQRLSGKKVRSLARLADGRLVALADSLYVRETTGWTLPPMRWWSYWEGRGTHLRLIDDDLWYLGYFGGQSGCEIGQYTLGAEGWESQTYCDDILAPIGAGQVLSIDDSRMTWRAPEFREDPAGTGGSYTFVQFLDGTNYVYGESFGFEIGSAGGMESLTPQLDLGIGSMRAVVGRSLDDYYVVDYWGAIWWVRDQEAELILEAPPETRVETAAALENGDVLLFTRESGVLRLREGVLDTVDSRRFKVYAAGRTRVVGTVEFKDDAYFIDGDGVTPTGLDRGIRTAGFLPDGRPVILAEGPRIQGRNYGSGWWTMVAEATTDSLVGTPARFGEECGGLQIMGGTTGPDGFYVWSSGASMVYRLAGDPVRHDWDLVAGPFEHQIFRLAVQADGSLIADEDERLTWHPGRP